MIRQVTWFRFKREVETARREEFIDRLRRLVGASEAARDPKIGTNLHEVEDAYHVTVMADFQGRDDMEAYNDHYENEPVADLAKALCADVSGGNYELVAD
ncbi:MAG: hypothetical protein Kow00120_06780 [Anaerolineae bacterium]